jgi:hypothetical protein
VAGVDERVPRLLDERRERVEHHRLRERLVALGDELDRIDDR